MSAFSMCGRSIYRLQWQCVDSTISTFFSSSVVLLSLGFIFHLAIFSFIPFCLSPTNIPNIPWGICNIRAQKPHMEWILSSVSSSQWASIFFLSTYFAISHQISSAHLSGKRRDSCIQSHQCSNENRVGFGSHRTSHHRHVIIATEMRLKWNVTLDAGKGRRISFIVIKSVWIMIRRGIWFWAGYKFNSFLRGLRHKIRIRVAAAACCKTYVLII